MSKHAPGYEITKEGKVFSVIHNWRGYGKREMKQFLNSDGYLRVHLTIKGKEKSYMVHKLVALHFLPLKPSPKYEMRHLDGNKLNNHISNLAWGTKQDNANDREKHGHTARGKKLSIAVKKGISNSKNPYYKHARQGGKQ